MGEAFWRFSLVFYSRAGVADALLRLQDRDGCDINLMLFALWCGAVLRRRLDRADLAAAEAATQPLRHQIVTPLRDLRRQLKHVIASDVQDLRLQIATLELAAERRVQHRLAEEAGRKGNAEPGEAAEANLALYLGPARAASAEAAMIRAVLAEMICR